MKRFLFFALLLGVAFFALKQSEVTESVRKYREISDM
jgi:hypothetical protein